MPPPTLRRRAPSTTTERGTDRLLRPRWRPQRSTTLAPSQRVTSDHVAGLGNPAVPLQLVADVSTRAEQAGSLFAGSQPSEACMQRMFVGDELLLAMKYRRVACAAVVLEGRSRLVEVDDRREGKSRVRDVIERVRGPIEAGASRDDLQDLLPQGAAQRGSDT